MLWDVDRGQTGMSEKNLKADQDVFFERKRLCKTFGRPFESVHSI